MPRHIYTAYNEVGAVVDDVDGEGVGRLNVGLSFGETVDAKLYKLLFTQSHSQRQPEWEVESAEVFECV